MFLSNETAKSINKDRGYWTSRIDGADTPDATDAPNASGALRVRLHHKKMLDL